jgi:ABC-type arginine transport system ATPase subunit
VAHSPSTAAQASGRRKQAALSRSQAAREAQQLLPAAMSLSREAQAAPLQVLVAQPRCAAAARALLVQVVLLPWLLELLLEPIRPVEIYSSVLKMVQLLKTVPQVQPLAVLLPFLPLLAVLQVLVDLL